ncbi:MAG: bifunctional glutamate N-acetyltransferase/amino-acid acetyltransferase ArgJ [Magnetococcales bacterium]|nr:bifunctional glutamate N-acetyltransferase/amino-acid acetyltransferase ArgJ [Magnetococcales bacterium]NGZ06685.1 bifunctional glutamate N-acetyltransferase/amino-acid acetyltransferase ArgJ [Magnetococcales bacterium]
MAVRPPPIPVDLPEVAGFRLATARCGIKNGQREREDLVVVAMEPGTTVAGVFTRNQVQAAPVALCRKRLVQGQARGLVVNSGNANAVTGESGLRAAGNVTAEAARLLALPVEELFVASTGVIGVPLPEERILNAMPELVQRMAAGGWEQAARAIMTTDTFPKLAVRSCEIEGQTVRMIGMAKGAGMIRPDMATMLGFVFTDASVTPAVLQRLLESAVRVSFNAITVDGDQSTNDTVLLFASGQAGHAPITRAESPAAQTLLTELCALCQELARMIVRDGEGATKFVTITVTGAASVWEADQAAMAIANSPLVKTALAGSDPNWGRILAAVGTAKVVMQPEELSLWLGEVLVLAHGQLAPGYSEEQGAAVMAQEEIAIRVDLAVGTESHTVWTCDLTHGYITINADYRT